MKDWIGLSWIYRLALLGYLYTHTAWSWVTCVAISHVWLLTSRFGRSVVLGSWGKGYL